MTTPRKSQWPVLDLIEQDAELQNARAEILQLPKFCTFDHYFAEARNDPRFWFMKSKPIKFPQRTPLEDYMSLLNVIQRPELTAEERSKDKLSKEDFNKLAEVVARAQPIPEYIIRKNALERKGRQTGDLENLREAARAAGKLGPASKENAQ